MPSPSYFVVCLHEKCSQEAADFIADQLSQSADVGGAGLDVHQEDIRPDGLIMHVSASPSRILQLAEDVGIKKPDSEGVIRELTFEEAETEFPASGVVGPLTLSDVHRCVLYAMEALHFEKGVERLPGHKKKKVMSRAPILSAYREAGLIDTFPLHDDEELRKLDAAWKKSSLFFPPVQEIRDYFGENVALYFSFTTFYTMSLIPIALVGILQFVLDRFLGLDLLHSNILFSLLNLVVVTVFLELWKRRSNDHNYKWGTGGKLRHKRPRPEFRGELGLNKVSGREEMQFPMKKTMRRVAFVSVPITLLCLLFAFFAMLMSFEAEIWVQQTFMDWPSIVLTVMGFVPSVGYSILVMAMNRYYLHLAHFLTEWENHRTQEQFERAVVSKLILFEFVNTFLALFYIGFYLQNIVMLKSQVFTMLITSQIVNQIQESVLPIVFNRPSTRRVMNKVSKRLQKHAGKSEVKQKILVKCEHAAVKCLPCLRKDDSQVAMANFSLARSPYESTYDDFMEIWLQFGHVFLFSSVYPLAGFFALLNNLVELKIDAYKMCRFSRKPTPRAVRDIGAWYAAFSLTSVASVITNCALLGMDNEIRSFFPDLTAVAWVLLLVAVEHAFLAVRMGIDKLIPDESTAVKFAMDRDDFILKNRAREGKSKKD